WERSPRRAARVLEPSQGGLPGRGVALGADAPDALDLAPLPFRVDLLDRRRRGPGGIVAVLVDADDDEVAPFDRRLDAIRRLLDLALLEPGLDRGERAAHR